MQPASNQCLIVDDSEVIRKVGRLIMEQLNYTVTDAESGENALEICTEQMPGLILLDWRMPGMSAQDFLASLANIESQTRPQVLYCTSEVDRADLSQAFAAGIADYILKPYDVESLQAKITSLKSLAN